MQNLFNNFQNGGGISGGLKNIVHSGLNTLGDVAINKFVPEQYRGAAFGLKDAGMNALRKGGNEGMFGIHKPTASTQGMQQEKKSGW